jgi:hypothetical protein
VGGASASLASGVIAAESSAEAGLNPQSAMI